MKITILQENLNQALIKVSKFVDSRAQLPILGNILIATDKTKLKLSATNLETGINLWLAAKIEEPGKITIPTRTIVDFVSALPADQVVLQQEKNQLHIRCRNFQATINGVAADEFPSLPSLTSTSLGKQQKFTLKRQDFIEAVEQVVFTAAIDETRPALTGVKTDFLTGKIQLAATDGYRLSLKTIKAEIKKEQKNLIIPAKSLAELAKICAQTDGEFIEAVLNQENNQIIFSFNQTEIITRLLEGEFPEFDKILPSSYESSLLVNREEFFQAVKAASIIAKDSANIIKLKIKKDKLIILANAPEVGDNSVELEAKNKGEEGEIAFNFRFLLELLNSTKATDLIMETSGPLKPGVFKPKDDNSFLYLIMPVRLQE